MRRTVARPVDLSGIGLHSGAPVGATILPAAAGSGISFVRTDVPDGTGHVPARFDLVTDTILCTKLCNEHGVAVGTVEHVMAALAGCGITDATVEVSGPEMPIMDGSAMPFVRRIVAAGTRVLAHRAAAIRIDRPVTVRKDGKSAALLPAERFEMDYAIVFSDSAIGEQALALTLTGDAFVTELADCRTFGHLTEVEQLRAMGLAKGGGLNNAIVVDRGRVLNPEGLRRPDEFVRHKMLDAVGDLALAGAPIIGRYVGLKSGHEMTNLLVRALFAAPDAWHWDEIGEREALGVSGDGLPDARGAAAIAV